MTLSINDHDLENGFSDKWKTVTFTDEAITNLDYLREKKKILND